LARNTGGGRCHVGRFGFPTAFDSPSLCGEVHIIVTPNVGVTYSGSTTMNGDHGGFALDDTNVVMLVANPRFTAVLPEEVSQISGW